VGKSETRTICFKFAVRCSHLFMLNDSTHDGKRYTISVSRYRAIKRIQRIEVIDRTFQFDGLPLMVH